MRPCQTTLSIVACFAILFGMAACGGSTPAAGSGGGTKPAEGSGGGTKLIGFSMKNANNPFFKVIADNLEDEAVEYGYTVQIVSGEEDVNVQRGQIKDWIAQQASAIVLNPVDSKAIGPAIREANEAGIPVFTCDLACTDPEAKVVTHIATDNYQGGTLAGEEMVRLLGEAGGQVLVLDLKSAESCVQRVAGFQAVVDAHNAEAEYPIEVVAQLESEGQKARGYAATQDVLQSHPELDAIFAINDPAALGAHAALEKAGRAGQIPIIGFDGQLEGKRAILEGKIHADPIQFPDRMGRMTMTAIRAYFAGEELESQTLIPSELYTKADAEKDPELAE